MKSALQLEVTFDQVLALVKKMPRQEKIKLTEELGKEVISSELTRLMKIFKTKELSISAINKEVEIVRQKLYDGRKN